MKHRLAICQVTRMSRTAFDIEPCVKDVHIAPQHNITGGRAAQSAIWVHLDVEFADDARVVANCGGYCLDAPDISNGRSVIIDEHPFRVFVAQEIVAREIGNR